MPTHYGKGGKKALGSEYGRGHMTYINMPVKVPPVDKTNRNKSFEFTKDEFDRRKRWLSKKKNPQGPDELERMLTGLMSGT